MSKYKALMLDLDGTTIPNNEFGMPSQKVISAVHKAQKLLAVFVVTGRYLYETAPILAVLDIKTPVVLLGGAQILDGKIRKFIYKRPLQTADANEVLKILKGYNVSTEIREENKAVEYKSGYVPDKPFAIFISNIKEELADILTDKISHISTVTTHKIFSWAPGMYCLNISHVTATKQHAIWEVTKKLGIKESEIIGIGDGYNDFPLLMASGFKVAMGNAVEDLKAIADYIAPSIDEDGVADVIEKFIL